MIEQDDCWTRLSLNTLEHALWIIICIIIINITFNIKNYNTQLNWKQTHSKQYWIENKEGSCIIDFISIYFLTRCTRAYIKRHTHTQNILHTKQQRANSNSFVGFTAMCWRVKGELYFCLFLCLFFLPRNILHITQNIINS